VLFRVGLFVRDEHSTFDAGNRLKRHVAPSVPENRVGTHPTFQDIVAPGGKRQDASRMQGRTRGFAKNPGGEDKA
jgi:hypothetical protein